MKGSPPPTRGTPSEVTPPTPPDRITPAYAGNTRKDRRCCSKKRDHPRLRGEHFIVDGFPTTLQGSPPPTRGTLRLALSSSLTTRITPAYAGNTVRVSPTELLLEDHPRLRGEHPPIYLKITVQGGSPPPTRGTLNR